MEKEGASCSGTGSTKCEWEKPMETFIAAAGYVVAEYKINNAYLVVLRVTQDPVLLIHPHLVVTVNLLFHTQTEHFLRLIYSHTCHDSRGKCGFSSQLLNLLNRRVICVAADLTLYWTHCTVPAVKSRLATMSSPRR